MDNNIDAFLKTMTLQTRLSKTVLIKRAQKRIRSTNNYMPKTCITMIKKR